MKFFRTPVRWKCLPGILCFLLAALVGWATTVIPPDFGELVNESDYIIRATVTSVNSEFRTEGAGKVIVTKVALDVKEVVAGTPPANVVLEILGGRVGDEEMTVQGAPRFKVGEEDILFVRDNGRTIVPLVAMMHGRYPVLEDPVTGRRYMARDNLAPLTDTAEVSQPAEEGASGKLKAAKTARDALTPEQFVQRIKSAVNPRHVRTRS